MTADLSVVPSGRHDFKCSVTDRYIPDVECAYKCNLAGGSDQVVEDCKDRCRVPETVISTVTAVIKTIGEGPVWGGASIRIKGLYYLILLMIKILAGVFELDSWGHESYHLNSNSYDCWGLALNSTAWHCMPSMLTPFVGWSQVWMKSA